LWSWYVDLETGKLPAEATLIDGRDLTLPQFMRELTGRLLEMCESGLITPEVAPEATDMLPRIIELTRYAEEGSIDRCARHLDWAAKLLCLLGSGQSFEDATTRLIDHDYSNTDPQRGAFWRMWEDGLIDPLIDIDDAVACLKAPPAGTRAWARGKLIERFGDDISDVNWSQVELRRGAGRWGPRLRIEMPELDSLNRGRFEGIIDRAADVAELEDLLEDDQHRQSDPLDNVTDYLASPAVK
jgi:proteasome accessory factor A